MSLGNLVSSAIANSAMITSFFIVKVRKTRYLINLITWENVA